MSTSDQGVMVLNSLYQQSQVGNTSSMATSLQSMPGKFHAWFSYISLKCCACPTTGCWFLIFNVRIMEIGFLACFVMLFFKDYRSITLQC